MLVSVREREGKGVRGQREGERGKEEKCKKRKNKMNELCICGYVDKWIRCG